MRRLPALFLACAAALAISPDAAAQAADPLTAAPFVGRPIAAIELRIEGQPTRDEALLDLIETRIGEPLSMDEVRETLTHLFNIGRFQGIEVAVNDAPAGAVALEFRLTPMHSVTDIEFEGSVGVSEGDLRRVISERYGDSPPVGRADAAARTLEQFYATRGFLRAEVEPQVVVRPGSYRTVLTFNIESGTQARVGMVEITGLSSATEAARVASELGLRVGVPYQRERLEEQLSEYVQSLRRRGYYEATADQRATARDNDAVVDVIVELRPGPIVRLAFEGDPLPRNRIADLVPIEREGSVDEDLLEDSERRIEAFLLEQGYARADTTHRREQSDSEQVVTFTVKQGPRFVIGEIAISGNQSVPLATLRALVPQEPGAPFIEARFGSAVAAIKSLYVEQGFTAAAVDVGYSETPAAAPEEAGRVDVRMTIREGVRSRVGTVSFDGNAVLADRELQRVLKVTPGAVFYAPAVATDRDNVQLAYMNAGYADTRVEVEPAFNADRSRVDLVYRIAESPRIIVDHIIVVGNRRTSEETVRRELLLAPGKPLAFDDLLESQRRLSSLGLFRRVRITEVPHGDEPRRDIVVTVEEADRTAIAYGGGLEASQRTALAPDGTADERLEFAPRGSFEIGRRNLWGRNRSLYLFTRVSFRPRGESIESPESPNYGFNEYRVVGTYREIGALRRQADIAVNAFVEQAIRSSFNFGRRGVNAELQRRAADFVRFTGRYSFGRTRLFDERIAEDEQLAIDRLFPQVRLSSFSVSIYRDTRDDLLDPGRGWLLGSDSEIAARGIGSQIGFAKTYLQAHGFRTISRSRQIVFAGGARLGLARGFEQIVGSDTVVAELPASERFFAGGSTTVRGFALDKLGAAETISAAGFALGGNALLVLNAEIRARLWRDVGGVAFVDVGNVFARVDTFDLSQLRVSPGFGLRYRSPIGPIRLDLGFKLDRRELSPGNFESPTAFHISVGHAF
jgi:outer membrane protein assembly complex protein YaeT